MKKLFKMLVLVLSIAVCASIIACKPVIDSSSDSSNTTPSLTVTLSGRIMHGEQPVEGVKVVAVDSRGNEYGTVVTAADGNFEFTEVAKTRAVSVTFEKTGYFTKVISLSISDIAAGKNVMGDIELEAPEAFRNLKGKVVAIDGTSPIAGATVKVKGFDISATTAADGSFSIENVPVSSDGTVLVTSKEFYGDIENVVVNNSIAEDGDIGVIYSYIEMPAIDGSIESKLSVVRGENSVKVLMELSKNLNAGQNIQVMFHVGDNAHGKLYSTMLFADANHGIAGADFEGRSFIPFERSIALGVDSYTAMTNEQFPATYTYSIEEQKLCYEIPYSTLGITADQTIGFAVMNVVIGGGGWVSPSFGVNMPTNGANGFINYTNMYDLTATGEIVARDISDAKVTGVVKNEEGEAIEGASITIKDASGKVYDSVASAADGSFSVSVGRLYGLTMDVAKTQYSATTIEIALEELFAQSIVKEVVLKELAGIATLKGSVKNLLGGKIAGVKVEVKGMDVSVVTDENGAFELKDAPIGTEGATLVFSAVGHTTIEKNIKVNEINFNQENDLGEIEMYSEFGGNGHTKFSVVREETGLRFKFVTEVSFQTAEIYWAQIMVGNNIYCFCLLPNDSSNSAAFGITTYHGCFTRDKADGSAWGAIEQKGDTWTVKNTGAGANEADWFIPYTEINMQPGEEFGVSIVAVLFEGHPNCIPFGYNMQPTVDSYVAAKHFYIMGTKNDYRIA